MALAAPRADRDPGSAYHLIGAHQTLGIRGVKPAGGIGIEPRQLLAKRRPSQSAVERQRLLPDRFGYGGNGRQPKRQRAKVKAGSADNDRQSAGRRRFLHLCQGERTPAADGAAFSGIEKTVEPMRRAGAIRRIGPCGQNDQVSIALQAVGVDDGPGKRLRQLQCQRGFAACRRASDDDGGWRERRIGRKPLVARPPLGVGRPGMRIALTLIAGTSDCGLSGLAASVAASLAIAAEPVWLAPNEVCDFIIDASDPAAIARAARGVVRSTPVDILVQPVAGRRKRLLVADLESTVIENEMLDELALILGVGPQVAEITRRAMNGEIDFVSALEARVALLAGIDARILDAAAAQIRLTPGARTLVATMRRDGAITTLVTGGFTVFADRVGAELGFDYIVANRLEVVGGRVTGKVLPPIVTGETKRETLLAIAAQRGIRLAQTIAVGDGANDMPMLTAAGIGIAFRAKPAVAAAARWRLDHADLTGLLYAQGYRKAEFAA